ncbi:MAG: hypothetical protein JNL73_05420 [Anaerolineales bacterium]|nr:hypothetical protein [Anaerolineales bacterium]
MANITIRARQIAEATIKPAAAAAIRNHPWYSRYARASEGGKLTAADGSTLFVSDGQALVVLKGKFQKPTVTFNVEIIQETLGNGDLWFAACVCQKNPPSGVDDDCVFNTDPGSTSTLMCMGKNCSCVVMQGLIGPDGAAKPPQVVGA